MVVSPHSTAPPGAASRTPSPAPHGCRRSGDNRGRPLRGRPRRARPGPDTGGLGRIRCCPGSCIVIDGLRHGRPRCRQSGRRVASSRARASRDGQPRFADCAAASAMCGATPSVAGVDVIVRLSSSSPARPGSSSFGRLLWTRRATTWPLNPAAPRPGGSWPGPRRALRLVRPTRHRSTNEQLGRANLYILGPVRD